MEKLRFQKKHSFEIVNVKIDDKMDNDFKPGLFEEIQSFLRDKRNLCTLGEQIKNISWYNKILVSKE